MLARRSAMPLARSLLSRASAPLGAAAACPHGCSLHAFATRRPALLRGAMPTATQLARCAPPLLVHTRDKKGGKGGKGGKKGKKGGGADAADDGADAVDEVDFDDVSAKMQRLLDALAREYGAIQAGRATPTMLDAVVVPSQSGPMPLAAVAKVLTQDARTLQVSVFDSALVPSVAKAIEDSPLQLNPEVHGKMLRVPVPRPTQACWYLTLAAGHGLPFGCPRALPHSRGPRRRCAREWSKR